MQPLSTQYLALMELLILLSDLVCNALADIFELLGVVSVSENSRNETSDQVKEKRYHLQEEAILYNMQSEKLAKLLLEKNLALKARTQPPENLERSVICLDAKKSL